MPLLVVAGGSNLLVADEGFPGTVVQIATQGIEVVETTDTNVHIRVAAGHTWTTSLPGRWLKASPALKPRLAFQVLPVPPRSKNVGAYGADISQTLHSIRVWDRKARKIIELTGDDLEFGYRDSIIKRSIVSSTTNFRNVSRWIVLSVDL